MEAAVNQGERSRGLAEIGLAALTFQVEVAVEHDGSRLCGGVKRFLSVEIEVAVQVDAIACQGIVGALHVAMVEEDAPRAVEGIHIEAAHEAHVARHHTVAVAIGHVGLRDGTAAPLTPEGGHEGIFQVHIAVVAHREVAHLQSVAVEVEHGEVAHGTLRLSAPRGEHHMAGIMRESDDVEIGATHGHAERLAPTDAGPHGGVVGVVDPIDIGCHIHGHGVGLSAVGKVAQGLAYGREEPGTGSHGSTVEGGVDEEMAAVELIVLSVEGEQGGTGHHDGVTGVEGTVERPLGGTAGKGDGKD